MSAPSDMDRADVAHLESLARRVRADVVSMSHMGRAAHLGSCLSCVDILAAIYGAVIDVAPIRAGAATRDRFLLSKGHAAAALYATLAESGVIPVDRLAEFNVRGGALPEHPAPDALLGVEAATGSLGHGLPLGVGMALAGRVLGSPHRVFVLMSDGECNEGSVWEAAQFAPAQRLSSLTVIVDFNRWQATGRSAEIMALEPLAEKWRAFGWDAVEVDGHDVEPLTRALHAPANDGRPRVVVAHTTKGKGVSFMEDDNNWHYRLPDRSEVAAACEQLGVAVPSFLQQAEARRGSVR